MRFGGTVELHLHMDICMSFEAVALLDPTVDIDTYRRAFVRSSTTSSPGGSVTGYGRLRIPTSSHV